MSPAMAGEFFTTSDTWEAQNLLMQLKWFCLLREFSSPISILFNFNTGKNMSMPV